jgi:hypothetical protein
MKSAGRMRQLESEGATVVVRSIAPDDLDTIAAANDLTFVATGRGGLANLFRRDEQRSVYAGAKRELVMLICQGIPTGYGSFPHRMVDGSPIAISLFGKEGEFFWVPFRHYSAGSCWCLVIEAQPGGVLDLFRDLRSYDECFRLCRDMVKRWTPWDWPVLKHMEPITGDPHAWLTGAIVPTVRAPAAVTGGGHPVMALGDTSHSIDPIAGQGSNCGVRQVRAYIDAIDDHEGPFDREWMSSSFTTYWRSFAEGACRYTNLFLEPLSPTAVRVMKTCFASQAAADRLFSFYANPPAAFPALFERAAADEWIRQATGDRPAVAVNKGMLRVLRGQVRARLHGRHFPYAFDDATHQSIQG